MPDQAIKAITVEFAPFARQAAIAARTANDETRTIDVTFSTGAGVRRTDWWTGKTYIEKLSLDPKSIRLDRLNGGAPVLNTHSAYDIGDQIGVVEDDSAKVVSKKAVATLRFSSREDVEPIWRDVKDRIIRNVSVGYIIHKFEETAGEDGAVPVRLATDWEPYEISLVPMPADAGAQTRTGKKPHATFPCEILTRGAEPADPPTEETAMPEEREQSETIVERNPLDPGAPTAPAAKPVPAAQTDADLAATAERERAAGITAACRAARMPNEFMDRLIAEGTPLVKAQALVFEEMRKRGKDDQGPQIATVRAGDTDNLLHVRAGIENAILHRLAPAHFKIDEVGKLYRGMTMLDIARAYLQASGVRVTNMSKNELAGAALGMTTRGGYHTTSDFPLLLADVANKTLRKAYDEAPQTFLPFVTRVSIPDYKLVRRLQLSDAPDLLPVKEHGEYTRGTMTESKEQYQLLKYGRVFAITREAIINDDTQAFSDVPMMFGRRARIKESDLVWAQITSNPTMGDGNALFSVAHGNLELDGDAISIESLGRARAALRMQTTMDGSLMNLAAKYLVVPPSLETVADQFVSNIAGANLTGVANPFAGKLQVIAEPRLETADPLAWYLFADPAQVSTIEVGYMEGEEGPQTESRNGFNIDGVEIKCRLDFGTKVIDWRGIHKDPGELAS